MNAFQLAITNFIQGYREGATENVDLSDVIPNSKSGISSESTEAQPPNDRADSDFSSEGEASTPFSVEQRAAIEQNFVSTREELVDPVRGGSRAASSKHASTIIGSFEGAESHGTMRPAKSPIVSSQRDSAASDITPPTNDRPPDQSMLNMLLDKNGAAAGINNKIEAEGTSSNLLEALAQAEKLAAAALQPGGISQTQRLELEKAIARAEAAMKDSQS